MLFICSMSRSFIQRFDVVFIWRILLNMILLGIIPNNCGCRMRAFYLLTNLMPNTHMSLYLAKAATAHTLSDYLHTQVAFVILFVHVNHTPVIPLSSLFISASHKMWLPWSYSEPMSARRTQRQGHSWLYACVMCNVCVWFLRYFTLNLLFGYE